MAVSIILSNIFKINKNIKTLRSKYLIYKFKLNQVNKNINKAFKNIRTQSKSIFKQKFIKIISIVTINKISEITLKKLKMSEYLPCSLFLSQKALAYSVFFNKKYCYFS